MHSTLRIRETTRYLQDHACHSRLENWLRGSCTDDNMTGIRRLSAPPDSFTLLAGHKAGLCTSNQRTHPDYKRVREDARK
jgi:hypothetical protein